MKGKARRAMTPELVIRLVLLMTLMPGADYQEILSALLGDLVLGSPGGGHTECGRRRCAVPVPGGRLSAPGRRRTSKVSPARAAGPTSARSPPRRRRRSRGQGPGTGTTGASPRGCPAATPACGRLRLVPVKQHLGIRYSHAQHSARRKKLFYRNTSYLTQR